MVLLVLPFSSLFIHLSSAWTTQLERFCNRRKYLKCSKVCLCNGEWCLEHSKRIERNDCHLECLHFDVFFAISSSYSSARCVSFGLFVCDMNGYISTATIRKYNLLCDLKRYPFCSVCARARVCMYVCGKTKSRCAVLCCLFSFYCHIQCQRKLQVNNSQICCTRCRLMYLNELSKFHVAATYVGSIKQMCTLPTKRLMLYKPYDLPCFMAGHCEICIEIRNTNFQMKSFGMDFVFILAFSIGTLRTLKLKHYGQMLFSTYLL